MNKTIAAVLCFAFSLGFEMKASNVSPQMPEQSDSVVYDGGLVDKRPVFTQGGDRGVMEFIQQHLVYPLRAQRKNIQGRVLVSFVIKADGTVSDINVDRSVHPLLDAEAVKLVKKMPKWIPGEKDGKAVDTKYVLPFTFRLN